MPASRARVPDARADLTGACRSRILPPADRAGVLILVFSACEDLLPMPNYRAVLLDMFDTLVDFHWARLPLVAFDGEEVRSTSPRVFEAVRRLLPGVAREAFVQAFVGSYREVEAIRQATQREVPLLERFQMVLNRLGLDDPACREAFLRQGMATHTQLLREAMEFPEVNRVVVDRLRSRYRLGVVSNFDHTPTVEDVLTAYGIRDHLETVVVSDTIGWRKPRPEIFQAALQAMSLSPREAVFVGDTPESDILGPRAMGMDVIWINRGGTPLPSGTPAPMHIVSRLPEIADLL
jgi:FMN phosphatase YigB (HAD superfamily)